MGWLQTCVECIAGVKPVPMEASKTINLEDGTWEQTFFDDFDGDCLKPWWQHEKEKIRNAGYWSNDAVFVKDSCLVIRADYRTGSQGEGWYMGAISTGHLPESKTIPDEPGFVGFSQTGGYFECKCRVPKAVGFWAAFWLMPDNDFKNDIPGTGEDGAEIDIFESPFMYQSYCPEVVSHAVHIDGYGPNLKSLGSPQFKVEGLYDSFHTYGLLWSEEEYVFYIDGQETFRTKDKVGTVSKVSEYMVLSVENAGKEQDGVFYPGKELKNGKWKKAWNGNPEKNDKTRHYDFEVDYVRVFKKKV